MAPCNPLIRNVLLLASCSYLAVHCFAGDKRDLTGCPKVFASRCACGLANVRSWNPDRQIYVTNCTNTGFKNTTMLEYLPHETEVLIFTGNHLEILPWNIFGIFDERKKLEVVDLTNNGIRGIQEKSFQKVTAVKKLILNHNDLSIVSAMHHPTAFSNFPNLEALHLTNAFTEQVDSKWYIRDLKDIFGVSQLLKLKKLHLEQNEIWAIKDNDMFCNLPDLMDLHLGDNQLTDINFSLDCLRQLRYLGLEYNKITNLGNETLSKLDKAFTSKDRMIDLHGNPFTCDCHFWPFFDWLNKTKINLVNKLNMRCYTGHPEYNAGIAIENIESLTCPEPKTTEAPAVCDSTEIIQTHAFISINIVLFLMFFTLAIYLAIKKFYDKKMKTSDKQCLINTISQ